MRFLFSIFILTFSVAQAVVPEFHYENGKCINGKGQEGLNPIFVWGQCTDFRGIVIGKTSLEGLDLSGSQFQNSNFQLVKFNKTILVGVSFEGAQLAGVDFWEGKISNISFRSAILKKVTFSQVARGIFDEADFVDAALPLFECRECSFKLANLSGANLEGAQLPGADFTSANLKRANLVSTDLTGALFTKASLQATKISTHRIEKTLWDGAHYTKSTLLPFPIEHAAELGMINRYGDPLGIVGKVFFHKVPVIGVMLDVNILDACKKEGFEVPCQSEANGPYFDDKCVDVGIRDGGSPMGTLSKQICGEYNPRLCSPLNNVFQYMAGKYIGGSGWCPNGSTSNDGFALCVEL